MSDETSGTPISGKPTWKITSVENAGKQPPEWLIDAFKNAEALQRVRELAEEWEVNCQRRLTTEVQPYERYQAHFAKELREALDGNDDD